MAVLTAPLVRAVASPSLSDTRITWAETMMDEGNYTDALQLLQEMADDIEVGATTADAPMRRRLFLLMGNIHLGYNDFENAILFYERALPDADTEDAVITRMMLLKHLTVCSCFVNDSIRALEANRELSDMEIPDSLRGRRGLDLTIGRAFIAKHFRSDSEAVSQFRTALEIIEKEKISRRERATPLSELYEFYTHAGQPDSALYYLERYDSLSQEFLIPQMMADSKRGLLHTYLQMGKTREALEAYEEYFTVIDSLYRPLQFISMNSHFHRNSITRAGQRVEELQVTVSVQKMWLYILIFTVILIISAILMASKIASFKRALFRRNREIVNLEERVVSRQPDAPHCENLSRTRELMSRLELLLSDTTLICDPDLSLDTVARAIGSNAKYVSQAVNLSTGDNFRSYLNARRISIARQRLTDRQISEQFTLQALGESVGFRSHANFVNAFKKITGLTPSAYMHMMNEG